MFVLHDLEPTVESFADAVRQGMQQTPKRIPCKYFYDDTGSELFDQICELDEYYPTRTELGLLQKNAAQVSRLAGPHCQLIELGSGASRKVRILLDALDRPAEYVPVDIARDFLIASAEAIARDYPRLKVTAVCADFMAPFDVPGRQAGRRVGFFPGSTIGNLPPPQAKRFLRGCVRMLGSGGAMLIGVDLKKDRERLNAAYNDAQGITAAFNLNLLTRINRELGGDFDRRCFHHRAFYNNAEGRIEMHIVSTRNQVVHAVGAEFRLAEGESIHTEDSYKYTTAEFQDLAASAGFSPQQCWTDPAGLFSMHWLAA